MLNPKLQNKYTEVIIIPSSSDSLVRACGMLYACVVCLSVCLSVCVCVCVCVFVVCPGWGSPLLPSLHHTGLGVRGRVRVRV